jgi:SAM-dependent methyltransferase
MTTTAEPSSDQESRESNWVVAGLCLIVASSIVVEVCLTKFVSYKVYYHFVYAIISTVILSAGFAGTCIHLFPRRLGRENPDPWNLLSRASLAYALSLIAATLIFCILPFDPFFVSSQMVSPWHSFPLFLLGSAPVALYFVLFGIPFFFAGLCVSGTLALSKRPAASIYFFDLLAAAAGAIACAPVLEYLGGYGTIVFASALGMAAFVCFARAAQKKPAPLIPWAGFAAAAALMLAYPGWALSHNFLDILAMKTAPMSYLFFNELHGVNKTYWNAVARIDVSHTGDTTHFETPKAWEAEPSYTCRFILVDGGAPTRQLKVVGGAQSDARLPGFLWSGPYHTGINIGRTLIIGAGGGLDILIGKYFKVGRIDALELNPSTYKHVLLGQDDSDADIYQPGLRSNVDTQVVIHNTEARHFCSSMPDHSVDLVQATAVDTLTAITSGALAMVENYLYTSDAVKDYVRVLKPGGILSLTHWRTDPPATSLRMFLTYLEYLDSTGVKDPGRYVVVTANNWWANEMMKTTPFTAEEVEKIRAWAGEHGYVIIFDPFHKDIADTGIRQSESIYSILGFLSPKERKFVLAKYAQDIRPVSDDKPFFYQFGKEDFFVSSIYFSTPVAFVVLVMIMSGILFFLPLRKIEKKDLSKQMRHYAWCFTLAGFAFLLSELTVIQLFSVFVGGPIYSLAVVLVAVLAGYATGSLISQRLKVSGATFVILAVVLAATFVGLHFVLPGLIHSLLPLPDAARIAVAAGVTYLIYIVTGIPVSLAMTAVKNEHQDVVAWMWGVSCAANAIGAMSFSLIAQVIGISQILLIVAVLYLCANIGFAAASKKAA